MKMVITRNSSIVIEVCQDKMGHNRSIDFLPNAERGWKVSIHWHSHGGCMVTYI